jgi:hypothetical protein
MSMSAQDYVSLNKHELSKFLEDVKQDQIEINRNAKYKIPLSSTFRNIKHEDLQDPPDEAYDLLLAKLELPGDENNKESFIIFECFFNGKYVKYYPEMIINICTNFLSADQQLRSDIIALTQISSQLIALNGSEDVFKINHRINLNKLHQTASKAAGASANVRLSLPSDRIVIADDLEDDDEEQNEPIADEYSQDSESKGNTM